MKSKNFEKQIKFLLFLIIILSIVLRFLFLDKSPPAPYSDEVNQAYNAYSILKTGRDEHGQFLPISFRSFGDWKPPLQTYIMIPSIFLWGLNTFSLRFPNASLGVLSIILTYLLVIEIFKDDQFRNKIALLTSFLLTISPWHLHQSRSAMLVIVALFFFMLGLYFFLKSLQKINFLYLAILSFVLSFYSYYGMRLIIPLFCIFLFIKYFKIIFFKKKQLICGFFLGFILIMPLLIAFIFQPDVLFGRAKTVNIFYDQGIRLKIWEAESQDGISKSHFFLTRLFHNKLYTYGLDVLKRFLIHFDGRFLFLRGDTAPPFRIPKMGVLYLIEAFFLPLGLYYLIKNKKSIIDLILVLLILGILPASFTFMTPSHNRTFNAVFPFSIIISYGIISLIFLNKRLFKKIFIIFITLFYSLNFYFYLINYYIILPRDYASDWLYGFDKLNDYLNNEGKSFSKVIFLPKTGMAYIYLLFYNKYDPRKYFSQVKHNYKLDEVGFEHVLSFDRFSFRLLKQNWEVIEHQMEKGELYVGRKEEIPKEFSKYEILLPNHEVSFRITYLPQ